jgi:plastocyanin
MLAPLRFLVRWVVLALAIGLLATLAACADETDPNEVAVEMFDDFFEPEEIEVEPGQPVRFVNRGQVDHNAIALDGSWQTDFNIGPGEDDVVIVDEPGTYRFYCSFHATRDGVGMAGTMLVGDAEADPDGEAAEPVTEWTGTTRHVPDDYPTVQSAVDAADPGDLILIGPGTYREQVEITTPSLVIRGADRNEVVIDGEHVREMGIIITADGVAVENLTVRDALKNGAYWRGVTGFRGSYLTAIGNVDYGIYSFDSTDGVFEHSYASGSADAGYYVGQCRPCRVILDNVTAEYNGMGYSGTNAGGDLYIVRSTWQRNGGGIVPNTLDSQRDPPTRQPTIVGNSVRDNGEPDVPYLSWTWAAFGNGIMLPGVREAVVERNLVLDNAYNGVLIHANLDRNYWFTADNVIRDNIVRGSGRADLAFGGPGAGGDCWSDNDVGRTTPRGLQRTQGCEGLRIPRISMGATGVAAGHFAGRPTIDDLVTRVAAQPEPGPLEQMPGGADADVRPAHEAYADHDLDLDAIATPEWDGTSAAPTSVMLLGVPLTGGTGWEIGLGLLWSLLPILYLVLVVVALIDLARQRGRPAAVRGVWAAAVVLLPVVGLIAYYALGGSRIAWPGRLALVGGVVLGWPIAAVAALWAAGLL